MIKRQEIFSPPQIPLSCYPFGVGNFTEGVAILVNIGKYRILLDCGLADIDSLCHDIDWVFCSHAHEDHARGLLKLHKRFPDLPIYASEVTAKLLPLNWLNQKQDTSFSFIQTLPLSSQNTVNNSSDKNTTPSIPLASDLTVELFCAGHLPGAVAFLFRYYYNNRVYKIFYTGDFCLSNLQLVEGLSLDSLRGLNPDVLIIEGSYGTARHPHRRQQEKHLMERIKSALDDNISVILPVPTFGLGQELLKVLRSHHQFTGKNLDIWVDGDLPKACDLYLQLMAYFPANVQNFAKHQPLFWDDKIKPRMLRVDNQIPRHELIKTPSIVLTDNLNHLREYCDKSPEKWLILISEQSKINYNPVFKEFRENLNSHKITLEDYLLAEHSDGRNTTQLIHNLRPQHIVFVHGSINYLGDLTSLEELQNRYQLHSPTVGMSVDLPIGMQFVQPKVSLQNNYEGELNETGAYITITLPEQLNKDPRWQNFADTGLVEARWQGEELVLKGLSQRELLQQNSLLRRQLNTESCGNCLYYQDKFCTNHDSPLNSLKVPNDGYCPLFESF
ncbi:MAG: MBL fold metallo-hydrolase [Cyanobacteria bacterium]|nr:MBL fold metallo-hydrolase [Cyanobacteria bacterium CG_2015-16_32_12]NCO78508.1 MBL fold metallo-hydrolase [Cyanobacteria bacterium CG_2015-22_32_23]NCQ04852.1 MBL fold metallo-hydrolase [Cyanobacteria bacterium CG_2015-09_32_10]NCQ42480.1 MBL fold metallo-hydrolase [Cyanobacteria bacterium CG_2015-04_32_10]NCS85625.1 MBL fold metallo-hydrolase [Cyanobacteria bacterium CG_2015-02_32_10]